MAHFHFCGGEPKPAGLNGSRTGNSRTVYSSFPMFATTDCHIRTTIMNEDWRLDPGFVQSLCEPKPDVVARY
jgi:hypothetical protein